MFHIGVPSPAATEEHSQAEQVALQGLLPRNDSAFAPFAGTAALAAGPPQRDGGRTLPGAGSRTQHPTADARLFPVLRLER